MTTPVNQQAACYFLANFVLVPKPGTMRGYLDFVIPLLKQREPSQGLLLAFSAVSLAALGTRPNSKALLPKADLWYLNALKEINSALRDPKMASSDSTLVSVMLMASFEVRTSADYVLQNAEN
jgi:Fungal specific transcription factor domain